MKKCVKMKQNSHYWKKIFKLTRVPNMKDVIFYESNDNV